MVVLPNGELMAQSISNSNSGEPNCQVVSEIYLPPYIDTALVRKIAIQSAQVSRYVYLNKPIAVRFKNEIYESRSVLKLRLKAYVLDIRYEFAFMSDMTETVIKELLRLNIITKLSAEINSTKKYLELIFAEQLLHLAFRIIKDINGMLSCHLINFLQEGQ